MREPFRIAFRNMAPPFGAKELASDNAIDLERLAARDIAWNVTIEKRHWRNTRGNLFCVVIESVVCGQRFVVRRDPPEGRRHEGLDTAITDAFGAGRRLLQQRGLRILRDARRFAGEMLVGFDCYSIAGLTPYRLIQIK